MKKKLCIIVALCLFLMPTQICFAINEKDSTNDYIERLEKNINDKNLEIYNLKQKNNKLKEQLQLFADNDIISYINVPAFEEHEGYTYYNTIKYLTNNQKEVSLCKYKDGKKIVLYTAPYNINFKVSPNNKYIFIEYDNNLILLDIDGKIIKKFTLNDISIDNTSEPYNNLCRWSDDSNAFWGYLSSTWRKISFYKINITNFEIEKYDTYDLAMNDYLIDCSFNPNTGQLCYSTYPVIFDIDGRQEFIDNKTMVNLKIYNFNTGENKLITSIQTNKFDPKWIDENTIEYFDGNKRIKINL